jgi:hypothetical protein
MKLNYRGTGYEANTVDSNSFNSQPTATDLTYRGVSYHADFPTKAVAEEVNADLTYRGVTYHHSEAVTASETTSETLKYRGVAYTPATQPAPDVAVELKYRGVAYCADHTPVAAPTTELKYRGVAYDASVPVAADAEVEAPVVTEAVPPAATVVQAVFSTNERARALMMNHHRMVKQRQQVMLVRLAESVGLPIDQAAPYWNPIQGKIHPSFWATYDRGHASAS